MPENIGQSSCRFIAAVASVIVNFWFFASCSDDTRVLTAFIDVDDTRDYLTFEPDASNWTRVAREWARSRQLQFVGVVEEDELVERVLEKMAQELDALLLRQPEILQLYDLPLVTRACACTHIHA